MQREQELRRLRQRRGRILRERAPCDRGSRRGCSARPPDPAAAAFAAPPRAARTPGNSPATASSDERGAGEETATLLVPRRVAARRHLGGQRPRPSRSAALNSRHDMADAGGVAEIVEEVRQLLVLAREVDQVFALAQAEIRHRADDDLQRIDVIGVGAVIDIAILIGAPAAESVGVAGQDVPEQHLGGPAARSSIEATSPDRRRPCRNRARDTREDATSPAAPGRNTSCPASARRRRQERSTRCEGGWNFRRSSLLIVAMR